MPQKLYDVVIIGAGVVGPSLAVALAKQHRSVALIERDLSEPNRIVGELMQPSGIHSLEKLGLEHCVEDIDAVTEIGYQVYYNGESVNIPYTNKAVTDVEPDANSSASLRSQTVTKNRHKTTDIEKIVKTRETGKSFHYGRFVMNLRKAATDRAPYVNVIEATVTDIVHADNDTKIENLAPRKGQVIGARIKRPDGSRDTVYGALTIVADGTASKFRKDYTTRVPKVTSHFAGLVLKDADLPAPHHGHVILGSDHAPVLVYQISTHETRVLFDIQGAMPSASSGALAAHLSANVIPKLPKQLAPAMQQAVAEGNFRCMPNQFLPTSPQKTLGLIILGDAWNMRHPLTGGGMTVALNDVVLVANVLATVPDLKNVQLVQTRLASDFYWKRKRLGSVINVLAQALYALFAAQGEDRLILQRGCFKYFQCGGDCVNEPVSLLSGVLPRPLLLVYHFFCVALYSIYCNFADAGILGFPMAVVRAFTVLATATAVILPFVLEELKWY